MKWRACGERAVGFWNRVVGKWMGLLGIRVESSGRQIDKKRGTWGLIDADGWLVVT